MTQPSDSPPWTLPTARTRLEAWLRTLTCRWGGPQYYTLAEKPATAGEALEVVLYTSTHRYRIVVTLRDGQAGMMGCVQARTPRAGEDWHRGNDLSDGPFTERTWQQVLGEMVAYELVAIAPAAPARPVEAPRPGSDAPRECPPAGA